MVPSLSRERIHISINPCVLCVCVSCGSGASLTSGEIPTVSALRRFGRCRSASASRRAGCCPSARWGTPGRHWEPAASASPEWHTRWGFEWTRRQSNVQFPCHSYSHWGFLKDIGQKAFFFSVLCNFDFFCHASCLSAKQRLEWNTFISKDRLQIIAIRQPAIARDNTKDKWGWWWHRPDMRNLALVICMKLRKKKKIKSNVSQNGLSSSTVLSGTHRAAA